MKHILAGCSAVCFVLGCASPEVDERSAEPSPRVDVARAGVAFSKAPPDFVARRATGDLALASGASGVVRSAVSVRGVLDDVAWDPWSERVITVEIDEGGEGGEIAARALASPRLGARAHLAWLDGRASVLASPHGAIVFEQSYGERWKLLGLAFTPSLPARVPSSAWLTPSASGAIVHGFDGSLRDATLSAAGFVATHVEHIDPPPAPGARMAPAPALGGDVIVVREGATCSIRVLRGGELGPASAIPRASAHARIEAVLSLEAGRIVVGLFAGPSAVVAASLDGDGAVESAAEVALPGDVRDAAPFPSRDLVAHGAVGALAATSAGVFSLRVTRGPSGIHLDLAPSFDGSDLRGPLAVVSKSP